MLLASLSYLFYNNKQAGEVIGKMDKLIVKSGVGAVDVSGWAEAFQDIEYLLVVACCGS